MKRNTNTKNGTSRTHVLISKDKDKFIILHYRGDVPTIVAPFEVINGVSQPSLVLDINRINRAQALLKGLPSVFVMHTDGRQITIDAVNKLLTFKDQNFKGIVQYTIKDKDKLTYDINSLFELYDTMQPRYFVVEEDDETKFQPRSLKVFPIVFGRGSSVCIVDAVEKILHTPILDTQTGFIGTVNGDEYHRVKILQEVWPELGFEFIVRDGILNIYSTILKEEFKDVNDQIYAKVHKNFGGSDITMDVTHFIPKS